MKLFNEKFIMFMSKFVNLQRMEIVTWCDPDKFENNINNMCKLSIVEAPINDEGISIFKDCCDKKGFNRNITKNSRCACDLYEQQVA